MTFPDSSGTLSSLNSSADAPAEAFPPSSQAHVDAQSFGLQWRPACLSKQAKTWRDLHESPDAAEELAEQYAFKRLSEDDEAAYEEHLLICRKCQRSVSDVDELTTAVRNAVARKPAF